MSSLICTQMPSIVQTQFSSRVSLHRKAHFLSPCSKFGRQVGKLNNAGFHLVLVSFVGGKVPCRRQRNSRGIALKCSITVPEPNEHSPVYTVTTVREGGEIPKKAFPENATESFGRGPVKAAFFDVDGTVTRTNVVMAYLCVRMAELTVIKKLMWVPWFVLSCIVYLIVDHFHRPTFNRIFYSSYKGRSTEEKTDMAKLVFDNYYKPRIMAGAADQILKLKQLGYHIVLVTGALDFLIAPLGEELGAGFKVHKVVAERYAMLLTIVIPSRILATEGFTATDKTQENLPTSPAYMCSTMIVRFCQPKVKFGVRRSTVLQKDFVYAAKLVEENGRFTGGVQGMSSGNHEKAERILDYAKRHGVSLRDSLAFGDSVADIPMLEAVGRPYAVNPDARLQSIALKRKWGILNWKITEKAETSKCSGDSRMVNL